MVNNRDMRKAGYEKSLDFDKGADVYIGSIKASK